MGVSGKQNRIDISIIIPAYNAEKFVERAVKSICIQEYLTWELILVENGSTDHTAEICSKFAEKDNRIRFYQSGKGVSQARNKGLQEARGDWICFLDADDYLYQEAFSVLHKTLQTDCHEEDMILFGHNSGNSSVPGSVQIYSGYQECLKFKCRMLENPTQYMPVWGKLFVRQKIEDKDLRFNEQLEMAEDADFTFRYLQYTEKICFLETQLYHYSRETISAVRSYQPGKAQKYIKTLEYMKRNISEKNQDLQTAFACFVAMHLLLILVHDTFLPENPHSNREKWKMMKMLLNDSLFSEEIKKIPFAKIKSMRMLPILFFKLKIYFPAVMMIKIRVVSNK